MNKQINETQKAATHVRIHTKNAYLMSMDLDATPDEVIEVLMKLQDEKNAEDSVEQFKQIIEMGMEIDPELFTRYILTLSDCEANDMLEVSKKFFMDELAKKISELGSE